MHFILYGKEWRYSQKYLCACTHDLLIVVGLGRFIDISMHRDTEYTDTRIDTLDAISRYFLKIEQQILFMLNLKTSHITFNLFTTSN